jgi:PST family polysaccharide transporter
MKPMNSDNSIENEKWFERGYLLDQIKDKSIKGGFQTILAQLFSFSINILTTIFLARLLLPEDYGLVAMVTAFTGFVLIFKDLGISQAIITKDNINQNIASQLFWLNFFICIGLAVLILALAPFLTWFYEEPKVGRITASYALVAIFSGLSVQHQALLSRQMLFKQISQITMLAALFSLVPSLILAYMGGGYWALVAINFLNAFITFTLLWFKCSWRPSYKMPNKEIKEFLMFGAGVSGFNMVNYFSRNLDNIIIGKFLGSTPLGLYSKAYQLLMLPITQLRDPLNSVGIPAMSSLRSQKDRYAKYYDKFLFIMSFFSMPITLFLTVNAYDLIFFALGEQWIDAVVIFQLLSITAFIQPIASTRGMVMISCGLSTRYFYWGLINAVAVTISFFVGIQFGLNGLAIAYAIVNYLILVPSLFYCFKDTPISVRSFFKTIYPPAFAAIVAAGINHLFVTSDYTYDHRVINLTLSTIIFLVSYLGIWMVIPQMRIKALNIINIVRSIKK